MKYRIADLFCGAGGTSAGAVEAAAALGRHPEVTAVNHWPVAIATHTANHPGSRHLCTGIDSVNPLDYFECGGLDLLWASPECTHHSVARGGKPINDQSRSTAWHVLNWVQKLLPPIVLVENVPEFATWGPVDSKGRPIQKRKGEIFQAWLQNLRSFGYKVDYRLLCAADYGDPTTRTRLFVMAVRGKRRIVWPEATHSKEGDLMAKRRWTPAREIIDWEIEGKSIFERSKPLSPKTMARIEAGLRKFGLRGFIVPQFGERPGQEPRSHDLDEPTPAVTSHGAGALVQPFIVPQQSNPTPKSVEEPLPTVVAEGSGPKLVQPFLIPQHSSNGPRSVEIPAPTVTTTSRGVGLVEPYIVAWDHQSGTGTWSADVPLSTVTTKARHGVAQPFLVTVANGGEDQYRCRSLADPVPTVTAGAVRFALAEPFLVKLRGGTEAHVQGSSSSIDDPCGTVTANGTHFALAQPFLVNLKGQSDAADIELPSPTITAHAPHLYMAEPFLVQVAHGASASEDSRSRSLNSPLPTVCGNRGDLALIEPFIISAGGPECPARTVELPMGTVLTRDHRALVEPFLVKTANGESRAGEETRAKDLADPLPTLMTSGDLALIEPHLLPQQSDGRLRPVSDPVPTVATSGAIALVEPFLIQYYGNGGATSIDDPLDTVTTKDRHAMVKPIVEIDGQKYRLDIRFRMLQPHELALAQGFPAGYKFTGTKTDQVKQIGNAVPRRLARALVAAAISQKEDVTALVEAEESEVAA
jgi:DNA (cytosine-5)-methyltransferase 1